NKIYQDSVELLIERGMGTDAMNLPRETAINTASRLRAVDTRREQAIADIRLNEAADGEIGRLVGKSSNIWANAVVDGQLAAFQARLSQAPQDPTERSEWMKANVPQAVADLQSLRTNMRSAYLAQAAATYGEDFATN